MDRFALHEETAFRAWLARQPRAVVLLRGDGCPYSATFERVFREVDAPEGWALALRLVEEGGHGPVAAALAVEITPTLAAFRDGAEVARLPGKLLLGITRKRYQKWLAEITREARR